MKNNLSELNNYLFECIERIQDDNLSEDGLDKEIKKSAVIVKISKAIIDNASLCLQVKKHLGEYGNGTDTDMQIFGIEERRKRKRKWRKKICQK